MQVMFIITLEDVRLDVGVLTNKEQCGSDKYYSTIESHHSMQLSKNKLTIKGVMPVMKHKGFIQINVHLPEHDKESLVGELSDIPSEMWYVNECFK